MKQDLIKAIRITIVCIIFFCGVYTALIWLIAKAGPSGGNGEPIVIHGDTIGYRLIGQSFTSDKYFWSRPSAVGYNAAGSGGSNKGPTNPDYLKDVKARIDSFISHNPGVRMQDIPADLLTASGSGEDPDISPEAALIQVERVAKARHLPTEVIQHLVAQHINKPLLNVMGPASVHVLELNVALDSLSK